MACKEYCLSHNNQSIENVELCSLSLEIFLRAHYLLKNFVDFFKFHACTCDDISYDQIPLHGALDVMAAAMTSIICGKMSNEESQRSGLFHDTSVCVQYRTVQDLPEDIIQKVDAILKCLQKSCAIENIICQVKDVLRILEKSSTCSTSERLRNLSICMKEVMKKLVCCGQPVSGPLYNKQMKLTLNLVNKFIREWSGRRSNTRPFLRICKYCDSVISETTRQWGTFCCKNARQFHNIWKEWSLQQSISDATRAETRAEPKAKWLESKQFKGDSEDTAAMYVDEHRRSRTSSRIEEFQTGRTMKRGTFDPTMERGTLDPTMERGTVDPTTKRGTFDPTMKRGAFDPTIKQRSTREAESEVSSKKTELERRRAEGVDLTKATLKEKMGKAKMRRYIDRPDEYPITSDGRRKRDDVPYRSKLGKIRALSQGLQDTAVERAAVGKMRKIRKDRSATEEIEREKRAGKVDREREESTYDRRRRKKRRKKDALLDDEVDTSESTEDKIGTVKGGRKRRGPKSKEQTESDLTDKRKLGSASTEDKSTLGSEKQSKKGTSVLSKKGRKGVGSNEMDDDYSKKSVSRSLKRKPGVAKYEDVEIGHRHPIEYQLSNQHFVKLGWTMLPVAKTMKKVVHYRTMPSKPHLDWFENRRYSGQTYYEDGYTVFINFRQDGGEVFYPNGKLAVQVSRANNRKYDMCTVFSPGGKDAVGIERESQIVALFDSMGNGAIFDEDGATMLSYNQIGGIWRDNPAGLPFTWMWDTDQKKSITKTVYMEKSATHLENHLQKIKASGSTKASMSPASSRNKEKKVVEQKPVVVKHQEEEEEKEVAESGGDFYKNYSKDSYHFNTICIKLNDFISCRILNRRNINLQFAAAGRSIRIELGTILDLSKEVASYFVDSSSKTAILRGRFEKLTSSKLQSDDSLYEIARKLDYSKKSARQRKFMIKKYRPLWYIWKESGTRCRPR